MNWRRFEADEVIIHDIPRRFVHQAAQQLTFSTAAEAVGPPLKGFLERKVVGSLGRQGFDVQRDPALPSPVPQQIADLLDDGTRLVDVSKEMAQALYTAQTGVSPEGLLAVVLGKIDGNPAVAMLKVERLQGVRVEQRQQSLTLQYINDLVLNEKTRVFKAAVFEKRGQSLDTLDGRVADDQRGLEVNADVASFWLSTFLGCRFKVEPRIATRDFFSATESFIDEEVSSPERKARYAIALQAQMHSMTRDIVPIAFAQSGFEADDVAAYRSFMTARLVSVAEAFEKDNSLISNQLSRLRIDYESGLMLLGPSEQVDGLVELGDGRTVIQDNVKRVSGR
jgi:hypothetical protein